MRNIKDCTFKVIHMVLRGLRATTEACQHKGRNILVHHLHVLGALISEVIVTPSILGVAASVVAVGKITFCCQYKGILVTQN